MDQQIQMYQSWMALTGPHLSCKYIHPGISCSHAILIKMITVVGKCSKFYAILHLMHFVLKLRKDKSKWKQLLKKTFKNWIGSILFMVTLVGGLKFSLCVNNNLKGHNNGYFLMKAAFPSSLCIIFEDQFRRREISYFVLVRALRSIYVMLKRRGIISIKNEANFCFILLFGVVSYLYYEKPNIIKQKGAIDNIWGQA